MSAPKGNGPSLSEIIEPVLAAAREVGQDLRGAVTATGAQLVEGVIDSVDVDQLNRTVCGAQNKMATAGTGAAAAIAIKAANSPFAAKILSKAIGSALSGTKPPASSYGDTDSAPQAEGGGRHRAPEQAVNTPLDNFVNKGIDSIGRVIYGRFYKQN